MAGVLSPFLTVEEAYLMARYLKGLSPANVLALGPIPIAGLGCTFQARPDEGKNGRHQLHRPSTLHDPCREVP